MLLIITDPVPPGPLDSNTSNFHPQKIVLRWPKDNYKDIRYSIFINGITEYTYSTEIHWPRDLEPDTSYTVQLTVYCWYNRRYGKSALYSGHIQTLSKWNIFFILPSLNFSLMSKSKK